MRSRALAWLSLLSLACAAVIRSAKQTSGVVRVDQIDFVAFPVAAATTFATFAFLTEKSGFHPKLLIRRDGVPSPSLYDAKVDMREHPEGVAVVLSPVEPGTYYFGFWGGELLYSYQYFAGPEDNVRYAFAATATGCSNELTHGATCDDRAQYIPLNDAAVGSSTTNSSGAQDFVLTARTNLSDSSFVGRIFVNHDAELLDVSTEIELELPGWNETAEIVLITTLHYGASAVNSDSGDFRDDIATFLVLPESSSTENVLTHAVQLTIPNPRVGMWTLQVTASARFGNATHTELMTVDSSDWCIRPLEQGIDYKCDSQDEQQQQQQPQQRRRQKSGHCDAVAWSLPDATNSPCRSRRRLGSSTTSEERTIAASISVQASATSCSNGNVGATQPVEVEYNVTTITDFGNGTVITDVQVDVMNETCHFQQGGAGEFSKADKLIAWYTSGIAVLQTRRQLLARQAIDDFNQTTSTTTTILTPWPYVLFQANLRDAPVGANLKVRLYMQGSEAVPFVVKMRCGGLPDSNLTATAATGLDDVVLRTTNADSSSYDSKTGTHVWTKKLARPVIQQQVDMTGRCYFLVAPEAPPAGADWSAFVQMQLQFDECGSSCVHGSCVITHGDVDVAMCECRYPYGGEDCTERAISEAQYALHVSLLVITNFAMMPGVVVAAHRRLYGIAAVLLSSCIASMFYHLCDVDAYCFGGLSFRTLQIMDMYGAFYSMLLMVLYFANLPAEKMWASAMVISPVLMLFVVESTDTATFVTVAIACGAVVTLGTWAYLWHLAAVNELVVIKHSTPNTTALPPPPPPLATEPSDAPTYWTRYCHTVINFFLGGQNFVYWRVGLGLAFVIAGFVCFGTMTRTNYWYVHSLWHVFVMGSTYLFITGRTRGPYQVFAGTSKLVDTAPPPEVTEAQPAAFQEPAREALLQSEDS